MPTIITHPAVLIAFFPAFRKYQFSSLTWFAAAVCSIFPDIDVVGFQFGIRYGDVLGHRGLTHSILFALLLSAAVSFAIHRKEKSAWYAMFVLLVLCTLSHGVIDAFTNGGLGIAFFSPFSNTRYFFPWQPLEVSPIGIFDFISGPAFSVLASELKFIWLPCFVLFIFGRLLIDKKKFEVCMAEYKTVVSWNRNGAVFTDNRYSRGHVWKFDGGVEVPASASPHVVPKPMSIEAAVDPEEAFVISLSSCHMLWFLSIAAKRGFVVEKYRDEAIGVMEKNAEGKLAITRVTLHPIVNFGGERLPDNSDIEAMHHQAHEECFIASSVKTDVRCDTTGLPK